MDTLKPCPFCGGEAETELCGKGKWAHWCVWCNCGVLLQDHKTEAEAIAAWNTRAERTCKPMAYQEPGSRLKHEPLEYWEYWGAFAACSACGEFVPFMNYCPNCGARVIGADE